MSWKKQSLILIMLLAGFFSLGFSQSFLIPYYILAGLILLCLLIFFIRYPHWGVYLMALLFPFTYLEVSFSKYNVPYIDALAILLFAAWGIKAVYLHLTHKKKLSLKNFPGWFFMLLFVIVCAISLKNVDYSIFNLCLKYLLRPIIFFYLMFVVLPFNILENIKQFYVTLKIMFVLGIGLALMGIWSLIFPPIIGVRQALAVPIFGLNPLGPNHNQLSEVFIVLIPMALILFWREKNIYWKNIFLGGALLMAAVNLLTLSRSGWIALGLEAAIILALKYKNQIVKIYNSLALYFLALLLIPAGGLMYLLVATGVTESATLNRLKLIDISLILFQAYPFFGAGIGSFTQILGQVKWYLLEYGDVLDAHGYIFKNLAETGLFGTVTFCALIIYFVYTLYKAFQVSAKTEYSWIVLGCLLAVAGIFTFQFFGTSYYISKTWLPVGLAMAALKIGKLKYFS